MIIPSKVLPLDDTALSKLAILLRAGRDPIHVVALYHQVADEFESIDQFLLAVDTLYVLGKIDVTLATQTMVVNAD